MIVFYFFLIILLTIFSYGFIDPNFPYHGPKFLFEMVYYNRLFTTIIYIIVVTGEFSVFWYLLKQVEKQRISFVKIKKIIIFTALILFFSFPAFSYDIFNYIATAKTTFFYKENPYLVMPIEFVGEPMLKFMHAANKFALYGPVWIGLTFFPHIMGFNNLILTIFAFKGFIALFYFLGLWLVWKLSDKNLYSLTFFALNPLVLIETLVSGHNDIVMMTLALFGLYLLLRNKTVLGVLGILGSLGTKYVTVILLPIFFFVFWKKKKKEKIDLEKIFMGAAIIMFAVMMIFAPIREEIYPWYGIWWLTFAALLKKQKTLKIIAIVFSFSLLLRYLPFIFWGTYFGLTPITKTILTFIPLLFFLCFIIGKKLCGKN